MKVAEYQTVTTRLPRAMPGVVNGYRAGSSVCFDRSEILSRRWVEPCRDIKKTTLTIVLLALGMLLTSAPLFAVERIEDIPTPRPDGWVTDLTDQLSAAEIGQINAVIEDANRESGAELAVVVVATIGRQDHRRFATRLFNHWGIGDRTRNDGVLLFAALDDRAAELILGDGIDGPREVRIADSIMQDTMVPGFRANKPGRAMLAGAKAALETIVYPSLGVEVSGSGNSGVLPQRVHGLLGTEPTATRNFVRRLWDTFNEYMDIAIGGLGAIVMGLWAGIRRINRNRPRRCALCSQQMIRLEETVDDSHLDSGQRMEEELRSADWDVWLCPACNNVLKQQYRAFFTRFSRCPGCRAITMSKVRETITSATEHSEGLARIIEECNHCDFHNTYNMTIPQVTSSDSGIPDFGGGSSSGGGASGRW